MFYVPICEFCSQSYEFKNTRSVTFDEVFENAQKLFERKKLSRLKIA